MPERILVTSGLAGELDDLTALAEAGIRQVWLTGPPDELPRLGTPAFPTGRNWELSLVRPGWLVLCTVSERELGRHWLDIVTPYDELANNPFAAAGSPDELRGALHSFNLALGLRYRFSPGATGTALMRALGALDGPRGAVPFNPLDAEGPGAYLRKTPPAGRWLHAYDINAMFLAAASEATDHAPWTRAVIRPDANDPGLPPPPFKVDGREHWYPEPYVRLAAESCWVVIESREHCYPVAAIGSPRPLRRWYERLRDARATLSAAAVRPACALALDVLKQCYTQSLGWLNGYWLTDQDVELRPELRAMVIARARANMHRHLWRLSAVPYVLNADTAVFDTDNPDPLDLAHQIGLRLDSRLGHWRHDKSCPVDRIPATARTPAAILGAMDP